MTEYKPLVMVVDDDEDIRELLKVLLESDDYRVVCAGNGRTAWEYMSSGEQPSLILLDLMMPIMDGEQFIKMTQTGPFASVPIVVMSGNKLDTRKLQELHANSCLVKPIELDDLLTLVHRFVNSQRRTG
jgi:CheY-like chemotaxis protein